MNEIKQILSDHVKALSQFTEEELRMGLECSMRVKKHLLNHLKTDANFKYSRNLEILNGVISEYQSTLDMHFSPSGNSYKAG